MRKLILTCKCGQKMRVPLSAVGKIGLCPTCGARIPVTDDHIDLKSRQQQHGMPRKGMFWKNRGRSISDSAKQRFGKAVDLFYRQHYAEALAIFDTLAREFPDNPDIEAGRSECRRRLKHRNLGGDQPRLPGGHTLELNRETLRNIVMAKLAQGNSDDVQLKAVEIALQLLESESEKTDSAEDEQDSTEPPQLPQSEPEDNDEQDQKPTAADETTKAVESSDEPALDA